MKKLPTTRKSIEYAWNQLAVRVGVAGNNKTSTGFEVLEIPFHYTTPSQIPLGEPSIIIAPCSAAAWQKLLDLAPGTLDWLPAHATVPHGSTPPIDESLPILFWGEGFGNDCDRLVDIRDDGSLVFCADLIATTLFMLARWEEIVIPTRDDHGRFPAIASLAYRQGFLDRPIVDEYALILREWLQAIQSGWKPKPHTFSVKLSHDIDSIRGLTNPLSALRVLGADLLKRHSPKSAWQTLRATGSPRQDPYFRGLYHLAQVSHRHGFGDDAFYFMATAPGPMDSDYDLASPLIKDCIEDLHDQGFEIGLHPGYHTFNNPQRLAAEKARLEIEAATGASKIGGRQHFLRFQVPDTWRHWEQAGFTYDSTMTYAGHEGFRCGTCHPFRPFDLDQDRELDLWEHPLVVMDGTLLDYRGLSPSQGLERILELAQYCKQVEGTFTLLWHNSSLNGKWRPWAAMYDEAVQNLAAMTGKPSPSH